MSISTAVIICVIIYFAILIVLGALSTRQAKKTAEDFFIAGRSFGTFLLSMSVLATLLSTFTFTGAPGLVYATGMGFIGGFLIGVSFFSVFIYFVGRKIWHFGKKYGFITPPELFRDRFESSAVSYIMLIAMFVFVLPYLALQPIGGGIMLNVLSGGTISYLWGAFIITLITIMYVWMSGQRAVAWNDAFQGILLLLVLWVGGIAMAVVGGGGERLAVEMPQLVERGAGTFWTWQMTFSWMILISVNIIMQPQVFSRYYTGRSLKPVNRIFVLWPLLGILSIVPIGFIGAYGKLLMPNLEKPDQVFPAFLMQFGAGAPLLVGIATTGLLAALMSTSSGQMLVLSSIFTKDVYKPLKKNVTDREEYTVGRIMVVVLALIGFLIGINPPALMATLAGAAFSGIAVLTPAAIGAFYWKRTTAPGVVTSVILGEIIILSSFFIPAIKQMWWGFDPVIPAVVLAVISLVVVSLVTKAPSEAAINRYFGEASEMREEVSAG